MKRFFKPALLYLSVIVCLLLGGCLVNDSDTLSPDEVFVKFYGVRGTDVLADLNYLPSTSEYLISGTSLPDGQVYKSIFLVKTAENGEVTATRTVSMPGSEESETNISRTAVYEDAITVVGSTQSVSQFGSLENKRAFYTILDHDLNITIADTLAPIPADNGQDMQGNDMVRTTDGNYVILGTVGMEAARNRNLFFTKITPQGDIIWRRTLEIPGDDTGVSIIELSSGKLAICARSERISLRGYGGSNVLYLVTNELGFLEQSLSYGTAEGNNIQLDDTPYQMIKSGRGGIIVGSSLVNNRERPFVLQINSPESLDSISTVSFDESSTSARINDVYKTTTGELLYAGTFNNFTTDDDIDLRQQVLFIRSDQTGTNNLSTGNFGNNFNETGEAVLELPDGKVLLGITANFGGSFSKMGLVKTNRRGQLDE